ncbi:MAG: DUF1223 domain-containing protein [Hyphomicrobium sp.]|jgi:hypothetical protein
MRVRTLAYLVLGLWLLTGEAAAGPRAVLELFTSQGCAACPPADRLFAELARDPRYVVLSLPVDYWDRTGWKDTFAKNTFTRRQQAYAKLRGDGQAYTPQAVVNGRLPVVGSDRSGIMAAAWQGADSIGVPIMVQQRGSEIEVDVGATAEVLAGRATVVVMPYLASREVTIGRGENAHSAITYTNIVREIISFGDWSGAPATFRGRLPGNERYDGVVVLLQEGSAQAPGAILGVDRIGLR